MTHHTLALAQALALHLYRKLGTQLDWPIPQQKISQSLAYGIRILQKRRSKKQKNSLCEQPFDDELLCLSSLYRRSRQLYLKQGGVFFPTLVTSPRSLSSAILLEQKIEYSPIERELIWSACDPIQKQNLDHLFTLRTYVSSLFHEQNHRLLWKLLPPPPKSTQRSALRRYQNFAESLVIVTDMALGDELGARLAPLFYLIGVTYDPGTSLKQESLTQKVYRNYLHAAVHATYLTLELYSQDSIEKTLQALFPDLGVLSIRAARRSSHLDTQFIVTTNQTWQKRYSKLLSETLAVKNKKSFMIPDHPMKNELQFSMAEKWFLQMGL